MSKTASLNGRLRTAFRSGFEPTDVDDAYALYNKVRSDFDLKPAKRLSSTLAKPTANDANVKLRKTAELREAAVSGRALAPGDAGGIEACPWRTATCSAFCLGNEGNYLYPRNQRVLVARKQFEFDHPREAWTLYDHEIGRDAAYAEKRGWSLFWRPDIVTDSEPWRFLPDLFARHPKVTFYGYTKNWHAAWRMPLGGWVLPNYRVAFSASELDQPIDRLARETGVNVAVVFNIVDAFPVSYLGVPVVDATVDDTWMLRHNGVIGALKPIGQKMKSDTSGFLRKDFVTIPNRRSQC